MNKLILAIVVLFINYLNFTSNSLIRLLPSLLFLIVILEQVLSKRNNYSFFNKNYRAFHILSILIIIGVIITEKSGVSLQLMVFKIISFVLFIIAFFGTLNYMLKFNDIEDLFVKLVYTPFLIYVILNLVVFVLEGDFSSSGNNNGVMLSYFGISHHRVSFLLANGKNTYGSVLGVLLTLSLILYTCQKQKKRFLIGIIASFVSLLLTDSRGPVLYSFLVFIIIKLIINKKRPPKIVWLLPLVGFIGPILLLTILSLLAQTSYGEAFSRSSGDIESGNSRAVIWFFAFNEFLAFKPSHHLFGYGEFGHYASGASKSWSYIFESYRGSNGEDVGVFMHPHNTFLSIAFDYGYIGLTIFITIQYRIVKAVFKIWNRKRKLAVLLLGNLIYWNLVGIGETMFGFYYQNVIYLFFMINVFAFVGIYKKNSYSKINKLHSDDNKGLE